ncbi:MAG TPA: hypothetical protein VM688_09440 [Nocardioidaceae bacterium]|nr:hypothetical protein [Nocardioidaceae bacterium]
MPTRSPLFRPALACVLALLMSALTFLASGAASAAPTAEFSFTPAAPTVHQPVTFRFSGTCDLDPCTVKWRWFQTGGSSLGTSMGQGEVLTYAFPTAGTYSVVARITNAGSTHGSATATHAVVVRDTFQDFDRQVAYDGWRGVVEPEASAGGYRFASATGSMASFVFTGTEVTYTARTGSNRGIAAVSLDGVPQPPVDLYSPTRGTRQVSVDALTDAVHRIRVAVSGAKNPASTGTAVTVDDFVVGTTRTDDRSRVGYNSWGVISNPKASAGTARNTAKAGAKTALTFYGTSVSWLMFKGPFQGLAAVFIDGRRADTVDGYAPRATWQSSATYDGLTVGRHTIRIQVLGRHSAASRGNRVTSDAFEVR